MEVIEFESVFAGYGSENVLNNVSLSFEKGQLISVVGSNGSGKSTLLKTATGMILPSKGTVRIDGDDILSMSRKEIARRVAYLSQGRSVPAMTVEQLVLHGRFPHIGYPRRYSAEDRRIADDALCRMGITDLSGTLLEKLSGGMRQNAYIAMALAQDTDYIFLDEPTTYLDISNRLNLMKILRSVAQGGKAIVSVMHDLPLAFTFSDFVVVVDNGTVSAFDTPENLYRSDCVKKYFGVTLGFCREEEFFYYQFSRDF